MSNTKKIISPEMIAKRKEKSRLVSKAYYAKLKEKNEYIFCEKCNMNIKKVSWPAHFRSAKHLGELQIKGSLDEYNKSHREYMKKTKENRIRTCPICEKSFNLTVFQPHCKSKEHQHIKNLLLKLMDKDKLNEYIENTLGKYKILAKYVLTD